MTYENLALKLWAKLGGLYMENNFTNKTILKKKLDELHIREWKLDK